MIKRQGRHDDGIPVVVIFLTDGRSNNALKTVLAANNLHATLPQVNITLMYTSNSSKEFYLLYVEFICVLLCDARCTLVGYSWSLRRLSSLLRVVPRISLYFNFLQPYESDVPSKTTHEVLLYMFSAPSAPSTSLTNHSARFWRSASLDAPHLAAFHLFLTIRLYSPFVCPSFRPFYEHGIL